MKLKLSVGYDKAALALAVTTTFALGTIICVEAKRVEQDFGVTEFPGASPVSPAGYQSGPDQQQPNLPRNDRAFTGIPYFIILRDGNPVDLSDPSSAPVHPPIPNRWWLEHGIDPSFADSPRRDPDRDGFTNLEEYQGGTGPNDFASHPLLLSKLQVVALEKETILLSYTTHSCLGTPKPDDSYGFRYLDSEKRRNFESGIRAGKGEASRFFAQRPGQLRFELRKVDLMRAQDPGLNAIREVYTATLIDRRPNKNGEEYRVEKSGEGLQVHDYTATFMLDAVGQGELPFEVEENASFSLPFGSNPAAKPYRFSGVEEDDKGQVIVIVEDEEGEPGNQLRLPVP